MVCIISENMKNVEIYVIDWIDWKNIVNKNPKYFLNNF